MTSGLRRSCPGAPSILTLQTVQKAALSTYTHEEHKHYVFIGQIGDPTGQSTTLSKPSARKSPWLGLPSHLLCVHLRFTITDIGVHGKAQGDKVWFTIECNLEDPIWNQLRVTSDNSRFNPQARAQLGPHRSYEGLVHPAHFGTS